MSILNRPNDGLFNVIVALHGCLRRQGSTPRDRLLALAAPPGAVREQYRKMARISLNTAVELGLFTCEPDGDRTVRLGPAAADRRLGPPAARLRLGPPRSVGGRTGGGRRRRGRRRFAKARPDRDADHPA